MRSNDFSADFIVIGSGLGGLCAAAYLSRANYRVIVLEKNKEIGGKCTTRTVNGYRYVIGVNGFGTRTAFILKELGIEIEWIPALLKIYGKKGYLSFPLSFSSISELKSFGMNFLSLIKMFGRLGRLLLHTPLEIQTYQNFIDYFVKKVDARELLYLEAWYIGAHPNWLPATAFKLFFRPYYGYDKPIYPLKGAQIVPNVLSEYIKAHGGEVLTGQNVTKIVIEKGIAQGVRVNKQLFTAKHGVISNAEIDQTLTMLKNDGVFSLSRDLISDSKSAFPFALLLLTLDASKAPAIIAKPTPSLETNATILPRPICEVVNELEAEQINESPVCNLVLSDLKAQFMNGADLPNLPIHVSILWPKNSQPNINIDTLTQSILLEIDKRYSGFAKSVLSSQWLTPIEYERSFGFSSSPAPVLETPIYTKHSWELPIKGLYNVGTTVQPSGSHAGCAMESGVRCATDILANI